MFKEEIYAVVPSLQCQVSNGAKAKRLLANNAAQSQLAALANQAEQDATVVAECVTRFGDITVRQFMTVARRLRGGPRNPWPQGAVVVREWLQLEARLATAR